MQIMPSASTPGARILVVANWDATPAENRAPHSASVAHWRRDALRLGFVAETETAAA
jgi:hypothetical protein